MNKNISELSKNNKSVIASKAKQSMSCSSNPPILQSSNLPNSQPFNSSTGLRILVTGSNGFVGKNLVANLRTIKNGTNKTRNIQIEEIFEYDIDTPEEKLDEFCKNCDFVFNLAGVNRPKDASEFMEGNFGFAEKLLNTLKKYKNKCPVMLSSSIQASLQGRFKDSEYGKSKLVGEQLFLSYSKETGAKVLVYRFPNLFGKWCKPNYNSAVATFCYNISRNLPITISNPNNELELLYIDDLVEEMFNALENKEHRSADGKYCYVPTPHKATLGEIVDLLNQFKQQPKTLQMPQIPNDSFAKKLYSTYLSYLPKEEVCFSLKTNTDDRGSFTEVLKTINSGQFSVNISKPGITKGEHWHNTKWEFFIVVSGKARIEQRKIGTDEVLTFDVSGDNIQAVHMLPGYTHNIINLSDTENLVTLMWANEQFNPNKPDTFFEKVQQ